MQITRVSASAFNNRDILQHPDTPVGQITWWSVKRRAEGVKRKGTANKQHNKVSDIIYKENGIHYATLLSIFTLTIPI